MLTEADIILVNQGFIDEQCMIFGQNMDPEETRSIANEAFLYAVRTYQPFRSRFHPYASSIIAQSIQKERTLRNERLKVESRLSLDMPLGEDDGPLLHDRFQTKQGDFINTILMREFLGTMPFLLREIASRLMNKYSDPEICAILQLKPVMLSRAKKAIRKAWLQYSQSVDF